jgi:ABC-type microcin C transport system permease subunit YejE
LAGNTYGRVIGIIAASLGALSNLTSIGGNNPWWRLGGFVLCVYILYGLIVFGHDVKEAKQVGQI